MQTHLKKQFRFMAVCFALLLGSLQIAEAASVTWCQTARRSSSWSSGNNTGVSWYSTSGYKYCGCYSNYYYVPVLSVTGASSLTSGGTLTLTFTGSTYTSATYTVYAVTACGTGTSLNLSTNLGSSTNSSSNTITIDVGSGIASASYIAIVSSNTSSYKTFSSATLTAGGGGGGGSTCSTTTFASTKTVSNDKITIKQNGATSGYKTVYLWVKTPGSSSYTYTNISGSYTSGGTGQFYTQYTMTTSGEYTFIVTDSNSSAPTDACGNKVTHTYTAPTCTAPTSVAINPSASYICPGTTTSVTINATGGTCTDGWQYSFNGDTYSATNTRSGVTAGSYTATVRCGSSNTCSTTSPSTTINNYVTPEVTISGTAWICPGGSTQLTASGASSYTWSPTTGVSDPTIENPIFTPSSTTTYTVTGLDGHDCAITASREIAVNDDISISAHPTDANVCYGETDNLSVTATGTGTLTYAWKYSDDNGNTWADAPGTNNTDVYSIPTTLAIGEHQYKVIIGSECGDDVTSDVAIVTVKQPTGITTQPENTSVCVGSSDDLYVEAIGAGTITYAWKYSIDDGANWADAPGTNDEDTYTLPTTLALGDYKFKVIVGSDCGDDVTSDVAVVSVVYTGSSITTQPSNATVCVGSSDDLYVEATGIGTLDYAWMYSDDNGNTWNTAGGTYDEDTYELPTTLAVGSHQYKVVIGAECGDDVVSNVVTVTVNALPSVTINGENAYATTTVSGTGVDLTAAGADSYEWTPNTEISANIGASITATPTATRTYTVTGSQTTAGTTCTATATADITVQYKITVLANNDSYGSVTGNNTVVDDGGSADISAIPATGYHFVEWNDADNNAARTITGIHANATYTATFAVNSYTISVESADISMGSVTGGDIYNYGNTATITAIPTSGYRFVEWNDHNTNNPREVLVTKDSLFTATFGDGSMDITVLPNNPEMGTVTGSGTYDYMSTATITAVPNDGYCFVRWADNNIMSNRKVTVTGAKTYYAIFEPRTYRITTKNDEKGTVTGGGNYKFNESVTITAVPNEGCHFEKWNNGSTENPITFNATKNEVFSAVFSAKACKLEVQANDSKMGTVTGAGTFDYNKTVTVKANPRNGYEFVKWEDGSTDAVRNITLTQDTLLTANFAALTYTLATDVNNPAMGSVEGAGNYEFGTKATLTAKANIGYRFIEWHDGNSTNPRTITIYGDTTYTATFAESKYIVSVKLDNKQGKVTGAGNYDYNSTATLSVTPSEGFLFDSWADGNTDNPRTITVTQDTLLTVNMVSIKPFSENSLYYEVVSVSPATVKVRPENTKRPYYTNEPSGDIVIPETITDNGTTYTVVAIGEMAFRYCKDITSIKLPETVTRIEDYAFTDCSGLEQINIPASVTYVGKHAFRRCVQLTEAPMGEGVETINDYAYCNLNVETFEIPANVKTLGFAVFRYANKLKKVVCNATVPPTVNTQGGEFTKYDVPLYVPAGSINAYKSHTEWGKFKTINAIE